MGEERGEVPILWIKGGVAAGQLIYCRPSHGKGNHLIPSAMSEIDPGQGNVFQPAPGGCPSPKMVSDINPLAPGRKASAMEAAQRSLIPGTRRLCPSDSGQLRVNLRRDSLAWTSSPNAPSATT